MNNCYSIRIIFGDVQLLSQISASYGDSAGTFAYASTEKFKVDLGQGAGEGIYAVKGCFMLCSTFETS